MYGHKKILLPLILLGLVTVLFGLTKTHAQTSSNYDVTVSPVFFDLSANPGDTVSDKIRIRNNTSSPIPIKLEVKRLAGDLSGNLSLTQAANDYTLSWIKFSQDSFIAKPLEWTDVPFSVNIPKDAAYGYYWTITFTQDNTNPLAKTGVSLTGAAAVPILLNVKKTGALTQGKLSGFATNSNFYEYPPVNISTTFQNTGNVHIRPRGNIFIKDWLGRQIAVLDVNSAQGTILPNAARMFASSWDDSFITSESKIVDGQPVLDKNGKPKTTLKVRFDKILDLRIGRYTASELIVITTDKKDIPFEAQTSFWIFPWKVVLAAILFVVLAGVGFFSTIRNLVRKILKLFRKRQKEENSI